MPRPNPHGWKNLRGGTAPANGQRPAAQPTGKKRFRWGRLAVGGLAVGVLTGLAVLLILLLGRSEFPAVVIVAPQGKGLAYPDNADGRRTGEAIRDWCRGGNGKRRSTLAGDVFTGREDWKTALKPGLFGPQGGTVLYLAAPGAADEKGPFVWLPPADPKNPDAPLANADKLHVTTLLTELAARSGPKLLVFDLTPGPLPWSANGVYPDFARALTEMTPEIQGVDGLAVVCSAGPDQTAWANGAAGTTVFGRAFVEALYPTTTQADVTAADVFRHVQEAVGGWSARRGVSQQTPILLPAEGGVELAKKMKLAKVPPAGFGNPPPTPDTPADRWKDVTDEWKKAAELEAAHPERTNPMAWERYLAWLLRWEQLVRDGVDHRDAADKARGLRERLMNQPKAEVPLVAVAAGPPSPDKGAEFDDLWNWNAEKDKVKLSEVWDKVKGDGGPAVRRWVAEQALAKLDQVGHTPENLKKVVAILDKGEAVPPERPVESHLVRLLARHLDPDRPAPPAVVKDALAVRKLAEQAAWGGSRPEQAFRWTKRLIADADPDRRQAEDLLYDGRPESHDKSTTLLASARAKYQEVLKRAGAVSAALDARDRVLAGLPFYARWVADTGADPLVEQVETAARAAHHLNALLAEPPDEGNAAEAVKKLVAHTTEANAALDAVKAAFDAKVAKLQEQNELASAWSGLDAALRVPFIASDLRAILLRKFDTVTTELDGQRKTPGTAPPSTEADGLKRAGRNARCAAALLGVVEMKPTGAEDANRFRQFANAVGKRFRDFPAAAAEQSAKAGGVESPDQAEKPLTEAARVTRLADPTAPVTVTPDPVEADRLYRRHQFLLWQAGRAIQDNLAEVGSETQVVGPSDEASRTVRTDGWYCVKVKNAIVELAGQSILAAFPAAQEEQKLRLTADCKTARDLRPEVEVPSEESAVVIVKDRTRWGFGFKAIASGPRVVGLPTLWAELPEPFRKDNPNTWRQRTADTEVKRTYNKPSAGSRETLTSRVLYRGHVATRTTPAVFSGDPTIEYTQVPPTAAPRMAAVAGKGVAKGAVTILVDRSESMKEVVVRGGRKWTRADLAVDGLDKLLESLPVGTTVSIAGFYSTGKGTGLVVEPIASRKELTDQTDRWRGLGLAARQLEPVKETYTPIAESVRHVLDPQTGRGYWPAGFTGGRSVVVLTDGEDTFDKDRAADKIAEALQSSGPDTVLHLVYFAMDDGAEKTAREQFKSLAGSKQVTSWPGVKDGSEFAERLKDQFRLRLRYTPGGEKGGGRPKILVATAGGSAAAITESAPQKGDPDLKPGTYTLRSGDWQGEVELRAGDQLLFHVGREKGQFALSVPPTAYDRAEQVKPRIPHAAGGEVYLSVPRAKRPSYGEWELTAVLERPAAEKPLKLPRPRFPWFDVIDDAKPDARPRLRVTNDPSLVAPAWTLALPGWDTFPGDQKPPLPTVTGYWIDAAVTDAVRRAGKEVSGTVDVSKLGVRETEALAGVRMWLEERAGKTHLIAEIDYGTAGEFPYLRSDWGDATPTEVHRYYDPQHRYTVTYSLPDDGLRQRTAVAFYRYAVADLRAAAGSARLPLPAQDIQRVGYDETTNLRIAPPK
jgi:hypothetical protein